MNGAKMSDFWFSGSSSLKRCPFAVLLVALDSWRNPLHNTPTRLPDPCTPETSPCPGCSQFVLPELSDRVKIQLHIIIFVNYSVCRSKLPNLSGNGHRNSENDIDVHVQAARQGIIILWGNYTHRSFILNNIVLAVAMSVCAQIWQF